MDIVLVGLSGSGKTEVARRLSARSGGGRRLIDIDAEIEREAGRSIATIFEEDGEPAFRALERSVIERLPAPGFEAAGDGRATGSVIATGGGSVIDPRNRWRLHRGRFVVWLDAPTAVLATRAAGAAAAVRPLLAGDLEGRLDRLRHERGPWYAAADAIVDASGPVDEVVGDVERLIAKAETADRGSAPRPSDGRGQAAALLRADSPVGRLVVGDGIAAAAVDAELRAAGAERAIVLTEPAAWRAVGEELSAGLAAGGWRIALVELPAGEAAKRLAIVESAAEQLVRLGIERGEPVVAVGGGALTDTAGLVAAMTLRGVPWIAVPTTLAGQLDAAIGGKTAVNLAAGKNLIGAFHPPLATIDDIACLGTLPIRDRRAAFAEAVKVGFLGEERLLEVLELDGPAIAEAAPASDAALAEVVERSAMFKLRVATADPREAGERIALNLGHTLGHALEVATGYGSLLHGEAVAYGLRLAGRLALARRAAVATRIRRLEDLLDRLGLGVDPVAVDAAEILDRIGFDKKRRDGRVRWVLPTNDGWMVDDGIPVDLVASLIEPVVAGHLAAVGR